MEITPYSSNFIYSPKGQGGLSFQEETIQNYVKFLFAFNYLTNIPRTSTMSRINFNSEKSNNIDLSSPKSYHDDECNSCVSLFLSTRLFYQNTEAVLGQKQLGFRREKLTRN